MSDDAAATISFSVRLTRFMLCLRRILSVNEAELVGMLRHPVLLLAWSMLSAPLDVTPAPENMTLHHCLLRWSDDETGHAALFGCMRLFVSSYDAKSFLGS